MSFQVSTLKVNPVCIISAILFCLFFSEAKSQRIQSGVILEVGGSGGLGSVNYERKFSKVDRAIFMWRAGFSLAPIDKNNGVGLVFPIMLGGLIGRDKHQFEFGLGQGVTLTTKGSFFALTTGALGYRYSPNDKRWFFRLTYTPLVSYLVDFQYQHWGGLSIGYKLVKE